MSVVMQLPSTRALRHSSLLPKHDYAWVTEANTLQLALRYIGRSKVVTMNCVSMLHSLLQKVV